MASSVDGVIGFGVSDGESINSAASAWATLSSFDIVGGSSPLYTQPGIVPTGGNPLGVTQAGTPAMKVTLRAGRISVPHNTAGNPPFGLVLLSNTDLDIAAANATNPRIDLVIAKIYSAGDNTSTGTFEILTGTAAAVPSRPSLPSGNYHAISIATVTVPANATTIVNSNITRVESDSWSTATSDARYSAGVGGVIYKTGLFTMSATRRQAWAALYPPATPWWDNAARVFGVTDGTDVVPLTPRKLYEVIDVADVSNASTTVGATVANSGTLNVFGGNRKIRVTASGKMATDRNNVAGWIKARPYLNGSGTIGALLPSPYTQYPIRVFGDATSSVNTEQSFQIARTFESGPGALTVSLAFLVDGAGGSGTGSTAIVREGCFLVEDIGPA